jgi:hypothetical protein
VFCFFFLLAMVSYLWEDEGGIPLPSLKAVALVADFVSSPLSISPLDAPLLTPSLHPFLLSISLLLILQPPATNHYYAMDERRLITLSLLHST